MKRFLLLSVVIAVASVISGCVQDVAGPVFEQGSRDVPFQIYASSLQTKTVNAGFSTEWEAGDRIGVFHAQSGSQNFVRDGAFTIDSENLSDGLFTGALSEPLEAESNDWYFIYPYNEYMLSPAPKLAGQMTLGATVHQTQLQQGKDNMSHISGDNYPLYTSIKGVPSDEIPSGVMKQLASLVAVNVINETSVPISVTSVGIRASEPLVGKFLIDITGDKAVCAPYDEASVSSTAMLQVSDARLDAGEQAKFYLAVKPFEAKADSRLTVLVNGSEKTIRLSEVVSFEEGKIKTLNVPVRPLTNPITTMPELSSMFGLDSTCHVDSGFVNGVPVDGFLVLGDKSSTGSVTLTGTVADFINMTEFGFFASSWTGSRSALTISNIKIETAFLGYEADYTMTLDQFAAYVNLPSSLFVLRPYPAGQFEVKPGMHEVTILDEEVHYYGVTEKGVDFILSLYGLSVEGLRKLINGEDNSYIDKVKKLVPDQLKAYFTEEMADMIIPGFRESKISVELSTMDADSEGNKIDPRVAIWGMNVYYTGD